ncbi:MAG: DnaD domain protein [Clostridia bacterium]|nr:DnaD domain protein [Clostridia bacterium]
MPRFVMNMDYIPVSAYFIENCLKDASGIFLKVYLFGLNLAVKGASVDTAEIASELEILESDVIQAIVFWKNKGLIVEADGVVEFCPKPAFMEQMAVEQPVGESVRHSTENVVAKISNDQNLSELMMLTQELLAKPLSQTEMETLYWFYDELGFSSEAILLILDYCISKEKRNMRYVEKVAIAWHEKGVKTAEQIMEHIAAEERRMGPLYRVQKGMGIADRALSNAEEQYISKWLEKLNMSEDMIMLAYEYCLLNTSKLSMPYMDKILERWHNQEIFTVEAAQQDNKQHRVRQTGGFNAYEDGFDHTRLEELTRKN